MPVPIVVGAGMLAATAARVAAPMVARAAAPAIGRAAAGATGKASIGTAAGGAARMAGAAMKKPTTMAFAAGRMSDSGDSVSEPESRNSNFSQGSVNTMPEMDAARISYMHGLNS